MDTSHGTMDIRLCHHHIPPPHLGLLYEAMNTVAHVACSSGVSVRPDPSSQLHWTVLCCAVLPLIPFIRSLQTITHDKANQIMFHLFHSACLATLL